MLTDPSQLKPPEPSKAAHPPSSRAINPKTKITILGRLTDWKSMMTIGRREKDHGETRRDTTLLFKVVETMVIEIEMRPLRWSIQVMRNRRKEQSESKRRSCCRVVRGWTTMIDCFETVAWRLVERRFGRLDTQIRRWFTSRSRDWIYSRRNVYACGCIALLIIRCPFAHEHINLPTGLAPL